MSSPTSSPVTLLLDAVVQGDESAQNRLWSVIYDELHRLAQQQMANEAPGRTLQTTALVHEAYLRLMGGEDVHWSNRRHFFGAAARAMRQIRIDDARRRHRLKRGGGERPRRLQEDPGVFDQDPADVLAINEALDKLEQRDSRQAEVVMLRYFAGLSIDECASAMGVSPRTVDADWRLARAWLHRELSMGDTNLNQDKHK